MYRQETGAAGSGGNRKSRAERVTGWNRRLVPSKGSPASGVLRRSPERHNYPPEGNTDGCNRTGSDTMEGAS